MIRHLFTPLVIIPFLSSCSIFSSCGIINDNREEEGNGKTQSEYRPQRNFTGVQSYGSFDVYVTNDSAWSVKVETDENLLQYIETSIEGDNLKIRTARGISLNPVSGMKVYVSAPSFSKLSTSGSGNIIGNNQLTSDDQVELGISGSGDIKVDLKAPSVSASISGSGNITVAGEAKSFKSSIAGNGDIRANKLQTEETTISIAGSGNANVNVSKQLDVHIAGSGDVKYSGNPSISQHIAGSGNIEKAE